MKKRTAEKVLSRSILALATYPKGTLARALKRRPTFWTEPTTDQEPNAPAHERMRLKFVEANEPGFSITYDNAELAAPSRSPRESP